ncbi:protein of unknown function [Lentzea xinjiangensis]|uniref:DUF4185 domain-containing protein n=1 Tax=Lentzea xinjiangensis TaxID=402600 RepID=A0A1H9QEP3_9PSEU|nr:DUF4185 domain-containing protein [Lentzea xinjiangensis]SER58902.1 protein of unknown function [Lentzea xinjiangensis]
MLAHLATTALLLVVPPPGHAHDVGLIAGRGAGDVNDTAGRFAVHATDLGVMWRDSRGRVAIAFGDTYGAGWGGHGAGPETADWRFNTLAHSTDHHLADGLSIDSMVTDRPGHAAQILPGDPSVPEVTVIPTAAVAVGSRDYLHYMSVQSWGPAGTWTTNYAGLAHSDDGGRTWAKPDTARWANRGGGSAFQLGAMVRRDGYVHLFGTPNGRLGDAYVSRVPEHEVLNLAAYQYWTGSGWRTGAPGSAVPVMSGQVGELSVQYNSALGRWVALHLDENRAAIVARTAPDPAGPWTGGQVVADGKDHPGLYGSFLHPDSATSPVLHFAMSRWDPYHVRLMRLDSVPADGNALQEGGFEHRTGAWRSTGQGGVDHGLGLARTGANNGWVRSTSGWNDLFQQVVVRPGTRYRLSGWVRSSGTTSDGYFGVRRPGGGGVVAEQEYGSLPSYGRLSVEFTATDPRAEVFTGIWARDGQDTWAQVDDLLLEPIG